MKKRIPLVCSGYVCVEWGRRITSIFLILLFTLISIPFSSRATHIMGSDLTFECQGPNQYLVRLKLFRDCNGINPNNSYPVRYSSATCGVNSSFSVSLVGSPTDITPLCPSQISRCQGGSLPYGVEEWIYEGVLSLPPGCGDDWVVSWQRCCRNNAITTLNNPGNNTFYVSTIIDNTLSNCNNSPEFLNFPTPFSCINQLVNYNHGVFDQDGDSLVFSLGPCMQDPTTLVDYFPAYNPTNPLSTVSGITIDPNTGDIQLTPDIQQVGVICVLVEEYRNGVKIGEVVRDMQFTVFTCSNNLPVATGIDSTGVFDIDVCEGENFCFDIFTGDVDPSDVVSITWNNGIPAGVFNVTNTNPPQANFCWTPTALDVGSHFFTVSVSDDHCPFIGTNSYAYTVNVNANTNPPVNAGNDVSICRGDSVTLTASSTAGNIVSWMWTDGINVRWGQSQSARPLTTTLYTVTTLHADGCSRSDDVLVTVLSRPSLSVFPINVSLCPGGTAQLSALSAPTATIQWTPAAGLSCTNCPNPVASGPATTQYTVTATDANGCMSRNRTVGVSYDGPFTSVSCDVIYVSPTGTGAGTKDDPADFRAATNTGQCNNAVIKMAAGMYVIDSAITSITSYTTIEGGFTLPNWEKTSAAGATTIFRSANNPEDSASLSRLVAIYLNSATNIKFQDLTIMTDHAVSTGHYGMSTYGVHITNCSNYEFTRCQIFAGNAGDGTSGDVGLDGLPGTNGADGLAGIAADDPGNGGNGGSGAGPSGGFPGAGGVDPAGCCSPGVSGSNGFSAGSFRDGAGGGGGGSGAETDQSGGNGGNGGTITGPVTPLCGGTGGTIILPNGGQGSNGVDGSIGAIGLPGQAGYDSLGLWVPGFKGTDGSDGQGGSGGCGGGGGYATTGEIGKGGGGGGGGGQGGTGGTGGYGGGASYGVMIFNNGANSSFLNCFVQAGTPGNGGLGGNGGMSGPGGTGGAGESSGSGGQGGDGGDGGNGGSGGKGGDGLPGTSMDIQFIKGSPPVTLDIFFNLAAQTVITASDVSCTDNPINFTSAGAGIWNFGATATPATAVGSAVAAQYDSTGRKTITYQAPLGFTIDEYIDFVNIAIDGNSYTPNILTSATPYKKDSFIVCEGGAENFVANISSADTIHWDFGGATLPNIYHSDTAFNLNGVVFNTPGTFHVVMNAYTSCCGWTAYDTINLIVEPQPLVNAIGVLDICRGDSALVNATGADHYVWSPPSGLDTTAGPSIYANPFSTTAYTLTGFSPRNVCTDSRNFVVTVHQYPDLTFANTDADCDSNGTSKVLPSTGGPYTYQWDDPAGQTTPTITGLTPGNYNVTITNTIAGCITTGQTTIDYGSGPLAYIDSSEFTSCFGASDGFASVAVTGGTGPYTYAWSTGATTAQVANLPAGTYMVLVNDSNDCSARTAVTVFQPPVLVAHILDSIDATCPNSSNGEAYGNAYGGTGSFYYQWNDANLQDSSHAVNLLPGIYTLSVVDQNGCTADTVVTINSPGPMLLDTSHVDINCYGESDAFIAVSASGGSPSYSYLWSNGQNTDSVFNLVAGLYSVTVTDSLGCEDSVVDVSIGQPTELTGDTVLITDVTCNGLTNGQIDISSSGGAGPHNYLWSNGATTEDVSMLTAGSYVVTISDTNNCSDTMYFNVYEPLPLLVDMDSISTSCNGFNDGAAIAIASGGSGSYSYNWSDGQTNDTATGLIVGLYSVTVADSNNCTVTGSIDITEPTVLVIGMMSTNVSCNGGADGTATAIVSGGTLPYDYLWDNGDTTSSADSLGTGFHTVQIIDGSGCTKNSKVFLTAPSAMTLAVSGLPATCFGNNDGQAIAMSAGGTGSHTYLWSDAQSNDTATSLISGLYSVIVTDSNGCILEDSVLIGQPSRVVIILDSFDVSCNGGADGIAQAAVSGGVGPYSFNWSNGDTISFSDSLLTGMAIVTVTDGNGCVNVDSILVNEPTALLISTTSISNARCNGNMDGAIDINVTGGTGAYDYLWSNGNTSQDISGLIAGSYGITVTDMNGCMDSLTGLAISQPAALTSDTVSTQSASCNGVGDGAIDLMVTGGTPTYRYTWTNGDSMQDISNLTAGLYSVTITDSSGCLDTVENILITQPGSLVVDTISVTPVSCNGQAQGAVDVYAAGGTGTYSFIWSNGAATEDITSVIAGKYGVTVTDVNGCLDSLTLSISEPDALLLDTNSTSHVSCNGNSTGAIDLNVSGGVPSYSYIWTGGDTTQDIMNLVSGNYSVTVTDGNGCSDSIIGIVISEPTILAANVNNIVNVRCTGEITGSIDMVVGGGTPTYQYLWSNGDTTQDLNNIIAGTYSVTVHDAAGCTDTLIGINITETALLSIAIDSVTDISCKDTVDGRIDISVSGGNSPYQYQWNTGDTLQDLVDLSASSYSLTVTDSNGCSATELSINVNQPASLDLSNSVVSHNDCIGGMGMIDLNVIGGTPVYQYLWSNSSTNEDLLGLGAGSYPVTVTDANGCTTNQTFVVNPANSVSLNIDSMQSVNCFGGNEASAIARATGGIPPYNFEWSNNMQDSIVTSLTSGYYTATVTDAGGCSDIDTIFLGQPTEIVITDSITNVSCFGDNNGSAAAMVTGGNPGYVYNWSSGHQSINADNLSAGTYSVTVTDQKGCRVQQNVTVNQPALLVVNIDSTNVSCYGMEDGQAVVYATGGTPGYSYDWSDGKSIDSTSSLAPGAYTVSVTDANGCMSYKLFNIIQPQPMQVSTIGVPVSCFDKSDGRASVIVTGGTPAFSYQWSTGETSMDISGQASGSYQVTVTDINGCAVTRSVDIDQPLEIEAEIINNDPTCYQKNDGFAVVGALGGTPPFVYQWSTGGVDAMISDLTSGAYGVTVTDANQCSVESSTILSDPEPISVSFSQEEYEIEMGQSVELSVDHNIVGDSIAYQWAPEAGLSCTDCPNPIASPYSTTNYMVTISNLSGSGDQCDAQGILEIFVDEKANIYVPNAFTPNQDGSNDLFTAYGENITDLEVKVYNRLGEKVHESSGSKAGWDGAYKGALQNPGVYVYKIEASFVNGKSELYKGSVTLIR